MNRLNPLLIVGLFWVNPMGLNRSYELCHCYQHILWLRRSFSSVPRLFLLMILVQNSCLLRIIQKRSLTIKTLAAHIFCNWKPGFLALCLWLCWYSKCAIILHQFQLPGLLIILITRYCAQKQPISHGTHGTGVLTNCAKFIGKHLCWSVFLNKFQAWAMQLYQKRDSDTGVFLWILWNSFKNTFSTEKSQRDCFCISI